MFGTWDLNKDSNPNLNFMWIPCQIWVQPFTCFWIQAGFKSGLNFFVGPNLLPLLGPPSSFLFIFFLSPPEASLLLSLILGHYRARTPLPSSPITEPHIFCLFITLSQTPTTSTTATTTPNPIFFPQISSTTHKKSQRSSKNKSGSDPLDSRLKIRFFENT